MGTAPTLDLAALAQNLARMKVAPPSPQVPLFDRVDTLARLPLPPGEQVVGLCNWHGRVLVVTNRGTLLELSFNDAPGVRVRTYTP